MKKFTFVLMLGTALLSLPLLAQTPRYGGTLTMKDGSVVPFYIDSRGKRVVKNGVGSYKAVDLYAVQKMTLALPGSGSSSNNNSSQPYQSDSPYSSVTPTTGGTGKLWVDWDAGDGSGARVVDTPYVQGRGTLLPDNIKGVKVGDYVDVDNSLYSQGVDYNAIPHISHKAVYDKDGKMTFFPSNSSDDINIRPDFKPTSSSNSSSTTPTFKELPDSAFPKVSSSVLTPNVPEISAPDTSMPQPATIQPLELPTSTAPKVEVQTLAPNPSTLLSGDVNVTPVSGAPIETPTPTSLPSLEIPKLETPETPTFTPEVKSLDLPDPTTSTNITVSAPDPSGLFKENLNIQPMSGAPIETPTPTNSPSLEIPKIEMPETPAFTLEMPSLPLETTTQPDPKAFVPNLDDVVTETVDFKPMAGGQIETSVDAPLLSAPQLGEPETSALPTPKIESLPLPEPTSQEVKPFILDPNSISFGDEPTNPSTSPTTTPSSGNPQLTTGDNPEQPGPGPSPDPSTGAPSTELIADDDTPTGDGTSDSQGPGVETPDGSTPMPSTDQDVNPAEAEPVGVGADLWDIPRTVIEVLTPFLAEDHLALRDNINIRAGDIGPAVGPVDSTALGTDQGEDASRATTVMGGAQLVAQLLSQATVDLSLLSEEVKFDEEESEPEQEHIGSTAISSTGGQQENYREEQNPDTSDDDITEEDNTEDLIAEAKRKEIERRRAELMKQYVNASIQIAEGMNAISSDFSARADVIGKFSEGVQTESAGYGLAQDVGRYVLFETLRGLALSSAQMGVQASRLLFEQEVTDKAVKN